MKNIKKIEKMRAQLFAALMTASAVMPAFAQLQFKSRPRGLISPTQSVKGFDNPPEKSPVDKSSMAD